ncbi:uncharacterized protein RSE6_12807 [Rhynchosporium secalis]|uniref:2EXR domain-containing protein n=1 Tax=Rhynchosporium secalis TaxID=38038 RepID=A0A1E1MRE5_RHYSE|nr:uncharacterized protein RSE6_12807 [Rhynchosporium secalis]
MPSLAEFHLFPTLPSELRLKVWALIVSEPRIVDLSCRKGVVKSNKQSTRFVEAFLSSTPVPPVLQVCRESRYEALATYKPHFTSYKSSTPPYTKRLLPRYIYLALGQDTIKCSDNLLAYLDTDDTANFRRLILDVADAAYFGHFNMEVVLQMGQLKELELYTTEGLSNLRCNSAEIISRDFEMAKRNDPGWECPRVRIISSETGQESKVIEAGALIPGWTAE